MAGEVIYGGWYARCDAMRRDTRLGGRVHLERGRRVDDSRAREVYKCKRAAGRYYLDVGVGDTVDHSSQLECSPGQIKYARVKACTGCGRRRDE